MADNTAVYTGTGRRKEAVARVRLVPGTGKVVVNGRDAKTLEETAAAIRASTGATVIAVVADVGTKAGQDALLAAAPNPDILVNNNGGPPPKPFREVTREGLLEGVAQNMATPLELVQRVVDGMIERRFGRIVNVASLAGLIPGAAGQTLYGPAKAFLVKFSQGLHLETAAQGVHVTALCPGFTYSEFHDVNNTREDISRNTPSWLWLGADEVAAEGYEAAEANRAVCVTGSPNKAIAAAAKLIPDDWALALMASQGSRFRKV